MQRAGRICSAPNSISVDSRREQPTRFYLIVNLKTAKALGITFPPSILLRATNVIEQRRDVFQQLASLVVNVSYWLKTVMGSREIDVRYTFNSRRPGGDVGFRDVYVRYTFSFRHRGGQPAWRLLTHFGHPALHRLTLY